MKTLPRALAWLVGMAIVLVLAAGTREGLARGPLGESAAPPAGQEEAGAGAGQEPVSPVLEGQGQSYEKGEYVGPGTCASANCHGNVEPSAVYDVLQNEFNTWFYEDPHRRAAEVLYNEESQLIGRNMRLGTKPHASKMCLDCHLLLVPPSQQAVELEFEDGISCEACHGPAGGWLARHNEEGWTHQDSVEAGMIELRSLGLRSELCLGCHLGERGQEVDHELIAAGHPELVFELDNYSEAMPAHWLPFAERRQTEGRRETHGVRAWAAGQAYSFREGLELLAQRARGEDWPEFAEWSCDSCHHDLKTGEWRQIRGYRYRAGLPPWSPARYAVLRHLVASFAPGEQEGLDREVERLARLVAEYYSPPAEVAASAERAAAALRRVTPKIEAADWSSRTVRDLIARIAADRDYLRRTDRQSAEQAALAVQSLVAYLTRERPALARSELAETVNRLFIELQDPYAYDRERFAQVLRELEDQVR